MEQLAASVAALAGCGDCIALWGELGMGKTAFARGFIQALSSGSADVTSPTFTLLQTYPVRTAAGEALEVWHYDLYRIEHESELDELGMEEALVKGIVLIEWPERAAGLLPQERLDIRIGLGEKETMRYVEMKGSPSWRRRLATL